jgi:hypothetical protein
VTTRALQRYLRLRPSHSPAATRRFLRRLQAASASSSSSSSPRLSSCPRDHLPLLSLRLPAGVPPPLITMAYRLRFFGRRRLRWTRFAIDPVPGAATSRSVCTSVILRWGRTGNKPHALAVFLAPSVGVAQRERLSPSSSSSHHPIISSPLPTSISSPISSSQGSSISGQSQDSSRLPSLE